MTKGYGKFVLQVDGTCSSGKQSSSSITSLMPNDTTGGRKQHVTSETDMLTG